MMAYDLHIARLLRHVSPRQSGTNHLTWTRKGPALSLTAWTFSRRKVLQHLCTIATPALIRTQVYAHCIHATRAGKTAMSTVQQAPIAPNPGLKRIKSQKVCILTLGI